MVRVTQFGDDGSERATIELDDFTVEILYSGIATMLRDSATARGGHVPAPEISRQERQRHQKVLNRLFG